MVRRAMWSDLDGMLELYLHLHERSIPEDSRRLREAWRRMMTSEGFHLIVNERDGRIVSSCTCVIIPNLTRGVRPYALIENVVTHEDYRNRGLAAECLAFARQIAVESGCYKRMLITGSRQESTLGFYRSCGLSSEGMTAFVERLL